MTISDGLFWAVTAYAVLATVVAFAAADRAIHWATFARHWKVVADSLAPQPRGARGRFVSRP